MSVTRCPTRRQGRGRRHPAHRGAAARRAPHTRPHEPRGRRPLPGLRHAEVVDARGVVVPDAEHLVSFGMSGGSLADLDNGRQESAERYGTATRTAFSAHGQRDAAHPTRQPGGVVSERSPLLRRHDALHCGRHQLFTLLLREDVREGELFDDQPVQRQGEQLDGRGVAREAGSLVIGDVGVDVCSDSRTRGRCPRYGLRSGGWSLSSRSGWRCRATGRLPGAADADDPSYG